METAALSTWLIWSNEHNQWWAPFGNGYVAERAMAGRFTFDHALEIVADANRGLTHAPNEAMVRDE